MCIIKFLYGKAIIALYITINMKRSLLKYFFIFILSTSASIVAQNYSLSFDGQDDYLSIPGSDYFDNLGDFSFSIWKNTDRNKK